MTPEEYAAAQAQISALVARQVVGYGSLFKQVSMTGSSWLEFLKLLFPIVQSARTQAATLARTFYDAQREAAFPGIAESLRPLEDYKFEWFAVNMDPVRKVMSQEDSQDNAVASLALRSVREVENAGRRQIIHAVENDDPVAEIISTQKLPEPPADHPAQQTRILDYKGNPVKSKSESVTNVVRGWARVATGTETCAWCLMLVSRGPVYSDAESAGLDLDDAHAIKLFNGGADVKTYFTDINDNVDSWHDGCDCKVVPVFKNSQYFSYGAEQRALNLWKEASLTATDLIESGKARTDNKNTETINVIRRRLYAGELNMNDFAALAA